MYKNKFFLFLAFFIPLGVYLKTLCPTIYFGDSAELAAAVYSLGIPHPTGYPLYCLIGKLFTFLPWGDIAYRLNIMSAFFAATTVLLLFAIIKELTKNRLVALAASLTFAFTPTFWSQATITEVYTLQTFFFAGVVFTLIHWTKTKNPNLLLFFSFFYGLSLSHHRSSILLLPAILFFFLFNRRVIKLNWRHLFFFLLGLTPYLYFPLRVFWGQPAVLWRNISSWQGIIFHVMGRQYQHLLFKLLPTELWTNFLLFGQAFIEQFSSLLLLLIGLGYFVMAKQSKQWLISLSISFSALLFFNLNYSITDITVYYLNAYLIATIWLSFALNLFYHKLKDFNVLKTLLLALIPLLIFSGNFRSCNLKDFYFAHNYGQNLFKTLPLNSVFLSKGDNETFITTYLKVVEKQRPDITIYDYQKNLFIPSGNLKQVTREAISFYDLKRPLFASSGVDLKKFPKLKLIPMGILYQVARPKEKIASKPNLWPSYDLDDIDKETTYYDKALKLNKLTYLSWLLAHQEYYKLSGQKETLAQMKKLSKDFFAGSLYLAQYYLSKGQLDQAKLNFQKTLKLFPGSANAHFGLAEVARLKKQKTLAIKHYKAALRLYPYHKKAQQKLKDLQK